MSWATCRYVTSADGTRIAVHTLGSGPSLIVVGGALQAARDYRGLARLLDAQFAVHVTERRGRGGSGPHGGDYTVAKEVEDLAAVQAATGATAAIGHSYGGLVVLEAMTRGLDLRSTSVFEPAVPINDSIPATWVPKHRAMLARGDQYGAFAHFIRSSAHAPWFMRLMPLWYLRISTRCRGSARASPHSWKATPSSTSRSLHATTCTRGTAQPVARSSSSPAPTAPPSSSTPL